MSRSPTHVNSSAQFSQLLSTNTYVIVDFHATWCGPCKTISPIFDQLCASEAKPGRVAFAKVDVDANQDVAKQYGVSAMPTFLVIKNSKVADTIRGANPSALRSAVLQASNDAAKGPAKQSQVFQSKGYTLGGDGKSSRSTSNEGGLGSWLGSVPTLSFGGNAALGNGLLDTVIRFAGLYISSLFAFNSYEAAEQSPFNAKAGRVAR